MEKPRTVIEPPSRFSLRLHELWQHRELIYFFTWRDIKVKYKQTYLGIAWALLQPLLLMLLFTFLFRNKFITDVPGIRYEMFVLAGLILWQLFQSAVSQSADSIVQQSNVIKKIYFHRLVIPVSGLFVALFDFVVAFLLFLLFCFFWQQPLHWQAILFFPAALALNALAAFGMSILISALNVKFRDFRYLIPFILQFLFFATQVIYSLQTLNAGWMRYALALNPVNGAIELFRFPLTQSLDANVVLLGVAVTFAMNVIGIIVFQKTEAYFADLT